MTRTPLTSTQWWNHVKSDAALLLDWLKDQYHGEVTAEGRIRDFANLYAPQGNPWRLTLERIVEQEGTHAGWVATLLTARGLTPEVLTRDERYWNHTLLTIDSFESGAAVAAHAEQMRLERIMAIAEDDDAPADIRRVFQRILPQEKFHARAFARMAGDVAMASALRQHELGMEAIGLIPAGF